MEVNGVKVPIILQNIFLFAQQMKETHTGLQQLCLWVEYLKHGIKT